MPPAFALIPSIIANTPILLNQLSNVVKYVDVGMKSYSLQKQLLAPTKAKATWIRLDVGGRVFLTTKETLSANPKSLFGRIFRRDELLARQEAARKAEQTVVERIARTFVSRKWIDDLRREREDLKRIDFQIKFSGMRDAFSVPHASVVVSDATFDIGSLSDFAKQKLLEQLTAEQIDILTEKQRTDLMIAAWKETGDTAEEVYTFMSHLDSVRLKQQDLIYVDRDADYFVPVLNYLRYNKLVFNTALSLEGILEEARFFQVTGLVELVENHPEYKKQRNENPSPYYDRWSQQARWLPDYGERSPIGDPTSTLK